jgi:hypothetical protein
MWISETKLAEIKTQAREEGARCARSALVTEMNYTLSVHKLLTLPKKGVHQRWKDAFAILFPESAPASARFDKQTAVQQLQAAGFESSAAQHIVYLRDERPEILVTHVIAVLSGIPEEQVWDVVRAI